MKMITDALHFAALNSAPWPLGFVLFTSAPISIICLRKDTLFSV